MAIRTDTLLITADEIVLDLGYVAIAKTYGWTETVKDEKGEDIPNPQSAKDKSIQVTRDFWAEIIRSYNSTAAVEAARLAALTQTNDFIKSTTVEFMKE